MSVARPPDLGALRVTDGDQGPRIDLSHLAWVDPHHLAGVAAIAHGRARRGERLQVDLPTRRDPYLYAARMRLGAALSSAGVRHDLPRVRERRREEDLLEVCEISSEDGARRLAALLFRRVRQRDGAAGAEAAEALHACLFEMADNVTQHSGATGFVAAQVLPNAGVVRFAIADAGVGLLGSLSHRGAVDDRDAARKALHGLSRTGEAGSGQGFPTTVDEVSRHRGRLHVASGAVLTRATSDGLRSRSTGTPFDGTLVEGTVDLEARASSVDPQSDEMVGST